MVRDSWRIRKKKEEEEQSRAKQKEKNLKRDGYALTLL